MGAPIPPQPQITPQQVLDLTLALDRLNVAVTDMSSQMQAAGNNLTATSNSAQKVGNSFTGLLSPLRLLEYTTALLISSFISAAHQFREAGMSYSRSVTDAGRTLLDSVRSIASGVFVTTRQLADLQLAFARRFMSAPEFTRRGGVGFETARTLMGAGVGGQEIGAVGARAFQAFRGDATRTAGILAGITTFADRAGLLKQLPLIFEDIAKNANLMSNAANRTPQALAQAVVQARRLGIELGSTERVADRLTSDFETYLDAQAKLQTIMPGIDLTNVMVASQFGSSADVQNALMGAFGGRDIASMPRSYRNMIAQAMGMSVDELSRLAEGPTEQTPEQEAVINSETHLSRMLDYFKKWDANYFAGAVLLFSGILSSIKYIIAFLLARGSLLLGGGAAGTGVTLGSRIAGATRGVGRAVFGSTFTNTLFPATGTAPRTGIGVPFWRGAALGQTGRAVMSAGGRFAGIGALVSIIQDLVRGERNTGRIAAGATGAGLGGFGGMLAGAKLGAIAGPWGIAIGGLLGSLIGSSFGKAILTKFAPFVSGALGDLFQSVKPLFNSIKEFVGSIFGLFKSIGEGISILLDKMGVLKFAGQLIGGFFSLIVKFIEFSIRFFTGIFGGLAEVAKGNILGGSARFISAFKGMRGLDMSSTAEPGTVNQQQGPVEARPTTPAPEAVEARQVARVPRAQAASTDVAVFRNMNVELNTIRTFFEGIAANGMKIKLVNGMEQVFAEGVGYWGHSRNPKPVR